MPKSSEKAAGAEQPANQRGKSRFGTSGRPGRVVLPERPPRVVDNEIVSILLGADPAALTAQAEEVKSVTPAEPADAAPVLAVVEAPPLPYARPSESLSGAEPPVGDIEATANPLEGDSVEHTIVEGSGFTSDNRVPAKAAARLTTTPEATAPAPGRARRNQRGSTTRSDAEGPAPAVQGVDFREGSVSSFEEFAERWKHGLRKGQLKVCEVLYQKTYAVGQTECVTSFAELGRLSGLQMRQCFNIIAQLEVLRFVERSKSSATSNKKDQGSVIRFHLYPTQ